MTKLQVNEQNLTNLIDAQMSSKFHLNINFYHFTSNSMFSNISPMAHFIDVSLALFVLPMLIYGGLCTRVFEVTSNHWDFLKLWFYSNFSFTMLKLDKTVFGNRKQIQGFN